MQKEFEELNIIKKDIDKKLANWNEQIAEEVLMTFKSETKLKKLVEKDNQLIKLKCLCVLQMDECMKLSKIGLESTVFNGINSLEEMEKHFLKLQFGMLRLECQMPQEKYEEVMDYIIRHKVSGIVLNFMIRSTTEDYLENVKKLTKMLINKKQYITAACLLREAGVSTESL